MRLFLLICLLFVNFLHAKIVYIIPVGGHDVHKFFYDPNGYRDEITKPFCCLREFLENNNYKVKFTWDCKEIINDMKTEEISLVISLNDASNQLCSNISCLPKEKCILFVFEPPVVMPSFYSNVEKVSKFFGKIFLMFDNLVDNKKVFKFHYPQPKMQMIENNIKFEDKKLCALIGGNKNFHHVNALYEERRKVISFFEKNHPTDFDLYGHAWGGHTSYKGIIANKWDVLKNYKFSFCYENMKDQLGYITEKIFDSMIAGCVPIYLGATNIDSYVPKNCFIDRRNFSNEEELYQFLKNMDRYTHEKYIQAIKNYFDSPLAYYFTIDNFIDTIKNCLSYKDKNL